MAKQLLESLQVTFFFFIYLFIKRKGAGRYTNSPGGAAILSRICFKDRLSKNKRKHPVVIDCKMFALVGSMDLDLAVCVLKMIRGEKQHQYDEADQKNKIRKCDAHIARMQICENQIDAIDFILEKLDGSDS